MPTVNTLRYPGLCALLIQWLQLCIPDAATLEFTTIQLTRNMRNKPRYDINDVGLSYGVCLGRLPTQGYTILFYVACQPSSGT